jgi:prevent-host-death family protein
MIALEDELDITVNIHEAKTHLSRLLARVMGGEEIIIAKAGRPIAKLVPYGIPNKQRVPGTAKGKIWISEDFDGPLPDEILESFER